MIGGIALLGTVTATLASWLVETLAAEKEQAEDLQVRPGVLPDSYDDVGQCVRPDPALMPSGPTKIINTAD
jgi:hypothetical protein